LERGGATLVVAVLSKGYSEKAIEEEVVGSPLRLRGGRERETDASQSTVDWEKGSSLSAWTSSDEDDELGKKRTRATLHEPNPEGVDEL